jgi:hypothetical protein
MLVVVVVALVPTVVVAAPQVMPHMLFGSKSLVLLADINSGAIDGPLKSFLEFAQHLLILPTLGLAVWSAWCFHENKIRDAVLSLVSAFLCSVAVPIVNALFGF